MPNREPYKDDLDDSPTPRSVDDDADDAYENERERQDQEESRRTEYYQARGWSHESARAKALAEMRDEPELDPEGQESVDEAEFAYQRSIYNPDLARAERIMREHMIPNGDRLIELEKFE